MKKAITMIMAALFCLGINANAQLKIKNDVRLNKIASVRAGVVSIYELEDIYTFSLPTTNEYDKLIILYLGDSKESAIETLKDLANLCDLIDDKETIVVDNRGKDIRLRKGNNGTIRLYSDSHAGYAYTDRFELNKLISALQRQ